MNILESKLENSIKFTIFGPEIKKQGLILSLHKRFQIFLVLFI